MLFSDGGQPWSTPTNKRAFLSWHPEAPLDHYNPLPPAKTPRLGMMTNCHASNSPSLPPTQVLDPSHMRAHNHQHWHNQAKEVTVIPSFNENNSMGMDLQPMSYQDRPTEHHQIIRQPDEDTDDEHINSAPTELGQLRRHTPAWGTSNNVPMWGPLRMMTKTANQPDSHEMTKTTPPPPPTNGSCVCSLLPISSGQQRLSNRAVNQAEPPAMVSNSQSQTQSQSHGRCSYCDRTTCYHCAVDCYQCQLVFCTLCSTVK